LPGMPSYPGWRINLGVRVQILPKSPYDEHKTSIDRQKNARTKMLYNQLEKEIAKTEDSKAELERLQKEKKEKKTAGQPSSNEPQSK